MQLSAVNPEWKGPLRCVVSRALQNRNQHMYMYRNVSWLDLIRSVGRLSCCMCGWGDGREEERGWCWSEVDVEEIAVELFLSAVVK